MSRGTIEMYSEDTRHAVVYKVTIPDLMLRNLSPEDENHFKYAIEIISDILNCNEVPELVHPPESRWEARKADLADFLAHPIAALLIFMVVCVITQVALKLL